MTLPLVHFEGALGDLPGTVKKIAPHLHPGTLLFLEGDLGAGKTSFVKALASHWGVSQAVTSPTFALMNMYTLPKPSAGVVHLIHLDLYRIRSGKELCLIGLETQFNMESVCLVEWASQASQSDWDAFFKTTNCARPRRSLKLEIELESSAKRMYKLSENSWA
jgi:tRNA threonylcarbamoyladenosine biosynthesis protein TsaE